MHLRLEFLYIIMHGRIKTYAHGFYEVLTINIVDLDYWRNLPHVGSAWEIQDGGTRGQKAYRLYYKNGFFCSSCLCISLKFTRSSFMEKKNIQWRFWAYIWENWIKRRKIITRKKLVWNGHLVRSSVSLPEILCYVNIYPPK